MRGLDRKTNTPLRVLREGVYSIFATKTMSILYTTSQRTVKGQRDFAVAGR